MNTLESEWLLCLGACDEAREYCATQPDLATAWAQCQRGDWMLWLLGRVTSSEPWSDERKPLVACALECAALALPYVTDQNTRGRIADEAGVILAWTMGNAAVEAAKKARDILWNIQVAAAAAASASAAAAAAYAAASAAAAAAYASSSACACAAEARRRDGVIQVSADIVRRHFPSPPSMERAL